MELKPKTVYTKKNLSLLLCFLMGAIFICLFSYSTSVLYPYFFGNDSAHFLTVGKAWYCGKVPYKEMFDHKGPLIYFIDMIGYQITGGNKAGVSFIQFIFMCFTLTAIFSISQLCKKSNLYGLTAVTISLIAMKYNYVEGNSVEEYCLPFLCWSMYGLLKWYWGGKYKEHSYRWAILYGITAGICLMTRVTNVVVICGSILVICIVLLKQGYVKNFFQNAGAFLLGFFIIVFPFVIYFALNKGLYDMFYDVLLFNLDYSKGCPAWILAADGNAIKSFSKNYFVYYIIFAIAALRAIHKDYLSAIAFTITAIIETFLFINGYAWPQYPLVCLVQVVLLLNETVILLEEKAVDRKLISFFLLWMMTMFLYTSFYESATDAKNKYNSYHTYSEREWETLLAEVPSEDLTSFVAYGGNEFKELYLLSNITPCYKYYVIQQWISSFTDVVKTDVHDTYLNGDAKWILTGGDTSVIDDILASRYVICNTTENYKLYKLALKE